jgi:hypothetical protein
LIEVDREQGARARWRLIAAGLLAVTVGEAVLDEGGFKPGARVIFGVLALLTLGASLRADRDASVRAAREPVALALWAVAALGALSAAWTVGLVGDSLRWALVTFGYGAVFVSAAVVGRLRRGTTGIAVGIAVLATVSTVIGIAAAASFTDLFADYVRGTWRPGGTLEYSAAMSLLAVSALPAPLAAMCARSSKVVAAGALSGGGFAIVLALDDSRAELTLAGLVCLGAIWFAGRTVRAGRLRAAGAVGTLVTVGVAADLIAGGHLRSSADAPTARTLVELLLVAGVPAVAWVFGRDKVARLASTAAIRRRLAVAAVGIAVVAVALAVAAADGGTGRGASARRHHPSGGFSHGRVRVWGVAIDTFADRPLAGYGADSFLAATVVRQHSSPVRFAHDLPLELAVELGVLGLLLAIALYAGTAIVVWRARSSGAAWLLAPAALAFMVANLIDWPWHLAGSGAIWAAALGGLASRGTGPAVFFRCRPIGTVGHGR